MATEDKFLNLINHPVQFRMYLFFKIPSAFFSGIKIKKCTAEKCVTSVPFKWFTQNPFRSTYFASLAMAAEMSTGVLMLSNTYKKIPAISMLVTKMEAAYFKKATEETFFCCEDGLQIANAVSEASRSVEGQTINVRSVGKNKNGELIAEFSFTWSIKKKE
ncbi:MAG: DUF4442 domain-containing protein [Bacteroidota bacterium]|nr:DUF4442 domain-containing protein [Bacteroidota bacterium]